MKVWGAESNSAASLNSTYAWDAVVDAAASVASGCIYPTIGAAIAAGARSILVRIGAYSENVLISAGSQIRIIGERPPSGSLSPRILGTLTVTGSSYIEVGGISLYQPAGGVAVINSSYAYMHDLFVYRGTAGQAFALTPSDGNACVTFERCRAYGNGTSQNGFYCTEPGAAASWYDMVFRDCWAYYQGGNGFYVESGDAATMYAGNRQYTFDNCTAVNCARAWAGHGFAVGRRPFVHMIGCTGRSNGLAGVTDGACGLYVAVSDSGAVRSVRSEGGWFYNNRGSGVALEAASSRVLLSGNHAHANGVASYTIPGGSLPGYNANGLSAPGANMSV